MPSPFAPSSIGSLALSNRFVRSATWEGMADDQGGATPGLIRLMAELARGGVGLIITSHAFVRTDGRAGVRQLGVCGPEHLPGLRAMAEAVHREQGKIALQLAHAGGKAATELTGEPAVGPSAARPGVPPCAAFTEAGIRQLAGDFARAAALAREAGFDAVQIHAAHGYLLSQFLSPHYNRRTDRYGGDPAGRAQALLETLAAVRRAVGDDYPVLAKLNTDDTLPDGVRPPDMVETATLLEQAGIDAVELSGGCKDGVHLPARKGRIRIPEQEVFYRKAARLYKERVAVPLILVGGIRSLETAEGLLREGLADYISLSRPLIREPGLVNRWKSGDRRPSECLSDNLCYGPIRAGQGIRCAVLEPLA